MSNEVSTTNFITNEENMTKGELLAMINSLLNSLNDSNRPRYRGLQQKTRSQLRDILQSIRDLKNNQEEEELTKKLFLGQSEF